MGLTTDMLKKIKEEIENDPDGLGYAGKSNAEIAVLLCSSVFKNRTVVDSHAAPINRILANMTEGPNTLTATEVAQAKVAT